jgi:hypothetical protein
MPIHLLDLYLLAGINDLFNISLLSLIRWLPAILSSLTIPAFALLAHRLLGTGSRAALATLIYALTPQAFEWQLMGGGITRALGALFAILVIYFAIRMFQEKNIKMLASTILMGTLTIYSHPEWALQAATAGLLVWWFFGRNKADTFRALAAAVGILNPYRPLVGGCGHPSWSGDIPAGCANPPRRLVLLVASGLNEFQRFHQYFSGRAWIDRRFYLL